MVGRASDGGARRSDHVSIRARPEMLYVLARTAYAGDYYSRWARRGCVIIMSWKAGHAL